MKNITKRLLSLLLTFTLILGMSVSGWAGVYALGGKAAMQADKACEIGATQYDTFGEALSAVQDGETIRLLNDIIYNSGVVIQNKSVTFDVGNFELSVYNPSGTGLRVTNYGAVVLKGTGVFTAKGTDYGVYADGTAVTLTNAIAQAGSAAYAINGGDITVNGFASGSSVGAYAKGNASKIVVGANASGQNTAGAYSNDGGHVTVNGKASGYQGALASYEGSTVIVNGTAGGTNGAGARADHGGKITVNGKVTSDYSYAIYAESDSQITVVGDVQADKGVYAGGNAVAKFGDVVVTGNVTSNNTGVYAVYGGKIHINGNVEGYDVGANCEEGSIYISGDVQGKTAVAATSRKCAVTIGGNVKSNQNGGVGVCIFGSAMPTTEVSGTVLVGGAITTMSRYIEINGVVKDGTPGSRDTVNTKVGYDTYSELNKTPIVLKGTEYATSFVWVKDSTDKVCEISGTQYATLTQALTAVTNGQTIKLLQNINHTAEIVIDGKSITFDVGTFILNVKTATGAGLKVRNKGSVALTGTGSFNVETSFSSGCGVLVDGGSSAVVTNAKSTGTWGIGVYTTVTGDAVTVLGNVVVTSQYAYGVRVWTGGTVTIEGTITTPYGMYEMAFGTAVMDLSEGAPDMDKPGYTKYCWPDTEGVIRIKSTSQVGQIFTQVNQGVPLKYQILTDSPSSKTVEVIYSNSYNGRTSFVVPETVTYEETIYNVTGIGYQAFYNCKIATDITIPGSIINIGDYAFKDCHVLENFFIPPSVKNIGIGAFAYGAKLKSINIPNGVKIIEAQTFRGCGFTTVSIPNGVTSIGAAAFDYCGLLTQITIPDSVTDIGGGAFSYCYSLTSVDIPDGVTSIKENTFKSCTNLKSVHIPAVVTEIGSAAFMGCEGLTEILIPEDVINIGDSAFAGCKGLTAITIPDRVAVIKAYTFSSCESLTAITIPARVSSIEAGAFSGCTSLEQATFLQQTPPDFGYRSFPPSLAKIYVPSGCAATYLPYTQEGEPLENAQIIEIGAQQYTVSFNAQGGSVVPDQNIAEGELATQPSSTRAGFTFGGWYKESAYINAWNFATDKVTQDTTLYAKWTRNTFTATLTIKKDLANYSGHGKTFTLKLSGNEAITQAMTGTGSTLTAAVSNGIWKVYDGLVDTKVTIAISGSNAGATLNYYTITFAVTDAGSGTGSTISATYNGNPVTSGDVVLAIDNQTLIITAVGAGAKTYTYDWQGTAESQKPVLTLTVSAAVSVNCTVTGTSNEFSFIEILAYIFKTLIIPTISLIVKIVMFLIRFNIGR